MATGDLKNNISKLQTELRQIHYDHPLDLFGLSKGDPSSFLPLIHYTLLDFSTILASHFTSKSYKLAGKKDSRFLEGVYTLLRDEFHYKPVLSRDQFLSMGFAERKLLFLQDVIRMCRQLNRNLSRGKKGVASSLSSKKAQASLPPSSIDSHDAFFDGFMSDTSRPYRFKSIPDKSDVALSLPPMAAAPEFIYPPAASKTSPGRHSAFQSPKDTYFHESFRSYPAAEIVTKDEMPCNQQNDVDNQNGDDELHATSMSPSLMLNNPPSRFMAVNAWNRHVMSSIGNNKSTSLDRSDSNDVNHISSTTATAPVSSLPLDYELEAICEDFGHLHPDSHLSKQLSRDMVNPTMGSSLSFSRPKLPSAENANGVMNDSFDSGGDILRSPTMQKARLYQNSARPFINFANPLDTSSMMISRASPLHQLVVNGRSASRSTTHSRGTNVGSAVVESARFQRKGSTPSFIDKPQIGQAVSTTNRSMSTTELQRYVSDVEECLASQRRIESKLDSFEERFRQIENMLRQISQPGHQTTIPNISYENITDQCDREPMYRDTSCALSDIQNASKSGSDLNPSVFYISDGESGPDNENQAKGYHESSTFDFRSSVNPTLQSIEGNPSDGPTKKRTDDFIRDIEERMKKTTDLLQSSIHMHRPRQ